MSRYCGTRRELRKGNSLTVITPPSSIGSTAFRRIDSRAASFRSSVPRYTIVYPAPSGVIRAFVHLHILDFRMRRLLAPTADFTSERRDGATERIRRTTGSNM